MKKLIKLALSVFPATRLEPEGDSAILSTDDIYRRRISAISAFGILVTAGFIALQFTWFELNQSSYGTIAAGVLGFALCVYGLWMGLWGEVRETTLRIIFVIFSIMVWLEVFRTGGITGYNAALLPVFPVLAAFLMRTRDAILFTALHITVIVIIAGIDQSTGLMPVLNAHRGPELAISVAMLMATVMACAGSALYMAYQNQRIEGQLRKLLIQQAYLAVHDYLSGLGNRVRLQQRFSESAMDDEFDILLIDLDGFKAVNDTYGHEAGDHLIKVVAERMLEITESNDLVIRLGGDEFVILLEQVDGTVLDVCNFGEHVIEILSRPYPWKGDVLRISASIGHARYPLHADSPSQALGLADRALYAAKDAGKSRCVSHGARAKRKPIRKQKRPFLLPPKKHTRMVD